ncbi:MAG: response regulator [Thermoanaerobaculia bacterium]|nr:response regulator [Thermoanaerobaculia bacterium]
MEREKRILVTDDDAAIRALLVTILRRRGFKVDTARDGNEAMQRCTQCRYSLVVLDLMMMSGYEFLKAIEALEPESRPMVLVLTAGNPPHALNPDVVAGSMHKPLDIEMLVDTVAACVTTSRERLQAEGCPAAETDGRIPASESGTKPN